MKVKDVMCRKLKTITPDKTIQQAAKIMNRYRIGSLVVESGIMATGIITERDILKAFANSLPPSTKVSEVMTEYVVTISPDANLEDAAKEMVENNIKRLPVVERNRAVGIVTSTDLVSCGGKLINKLRPLLTRKRKLLEKNR